MKNTPWEGGVRGIGLLWSPLVPASRRGRVVSDLIDVVDWLPTLFEAAGGNASDLGALDGVSHWSALVGGSASRRRRRRRRHTVHNIDDAFGYAAVRRGNWKLVRGTTYGGHWDGWYGPSGRNGSSDDAAHQRRMEESAAGRSLEALRMKLPAEWRRIRASLQVVCRRRPAATPCRPLQEACLFHIGEDPCELDNVAARHPDVLDRMLDLLRWYNGTAVTPVNRPQDPRADPKYWNYTYTNWADLI